MTKIKICGIRTYDNALMVAQAGADMIGLNFYPETPRYLMPQDAKVIVQKLRDKLGDDSPLIIGLFVNASSDEIFAMRDEVKFDFAQLSGDESASLLQDLNGVGFKSIRPETRKMALDDVQRFEANFPTNEHVPSLILDAFNPNLYGGTGETASVEVALDVQRQVPRMMLAGGLNPDNVAERIQMIQPWGVDVASGVEDGTPGIKDEAKVKVLIEAVKKVSV